MCFNSIWVANNQKLRTTGLNDGDVGDVYVSHGDGHVSYGNSCSKAHTMAAVKSAYLTQSRSAILALHMSAVAMSGVATSGVAYSRIAGRCQWLDTDHFNLLQHPIRLLA